jgi:hypothetical protein
VRHVDGRAWQVAVHREAMAVQRPESCGKPDVAPVVWRADEPEPLAPWHAG